MYWDYWKTWGYLNTQLYEKLVSFDSFMLAGLFLNDCLKQKLCMTIHVIKLKNICIFSLHSFSTPCYICPLMIGRGRSIWKAFVVAFNFPYSVNQGASVHDESSQVWLLLKLLRWWTNYWCPDGILILSPFR